MRRLIITLFLVPATLFSAIENVRIDTQTHQVQPPTFSASAIYDFKFGTLTTDITGGGGGSPGGATGELQYKSGAAAFGGIPGLTYNSVSTRITLQAGTKLFLVDSTDATKKVQLILSGLTTGTTRNFTFPDADFTGVVPASAPSNQFQTGISSGGNPTFAQPTDANLSTSDVTTNNASITKHGFVPKLPNDATKFYDGTGAYTVPASGGTPGGATTQLQWNNAGVFGGIPGFTYNTGSTLLTLQGGANFNIVDPSAPTKKATFGLANITAGQTRNVNIPDASSTTAQPITAVSKKWLTAMSSQGGFSNAQPDFTDLSGAIATSQQNIPVGKTLYVDSVNGNNATAVANRFDKPYLTLNGATGAIADAGAGDEINVGPGSFAETGQILLPANVSFVGSGAGVTTIVDTSGVIPATGDKIADMTIDARTGSNASSSFGIGADTADTAFTDVTIAGVEILGNAHGLYINKTGVTRVVVYDSSIITTSEAVFTGTTTGSISYYNCDLTVDGSIGGAAIVYGYNATSGLTNVYGGTVTLSNGVLEARALRATGVLVTLFPHSVTTNIIATTKYDLHQASSATLYNDKVVKSDGTTLLTSGTITQAINTYAGNIGLIDDTVNNASTTKHGFVLKLPNDATKYYDGTGAFTVPAGTGGGSSLVQQDVGDANATITSGTNVVNLTTTLTASRVLTLPLASAYPPKTPIIIVDPKQVESIGNFISVARAGSDTINGGTGNVTVIGVNAAGRPVTLVSDGVSKWATVPSAIKSQAFASTWDTVVTAAPTQNDVYDEIHAFDTDDDGKVNVLDQVAGITNTDSSGVIQAPLTIPAGSLVGTTATQTLTNKNDVPRTNPVASATSWTPDFDTYDMEIQTALAGAVTINAPTFTGATQGSQRMLRIKDNGTARAITWNGTYKPIGVTLPTTTVISKLLYVGMKYNSTSSQWDVLAVGQE